MLKPYSRYNLWRVTYISHFSSSSGMIPYRHDTEVHADIATCGQSITDVTDMIERTLTCQERLIKITEANFLGDIVVP